MLHPALQAGDEGERPCTAVRKRSVFYISGFDPQGPSHYHRLFDEQARLQASLGGYQLSVGPRSRLSKHVSAWQATFQGSDGCVVQTAYHFLRWDDLVREHWPRGRWQLAWVVISTTCRILMNGSWLSMCRLSWVAGLTLVLPGIVGWLAVSSVLVVSAILWALTNTSAQVPAELVAYTAGAVVTALFSGWLLSRLWRIGQGDWLMRSTSSLLRYARCQAPELDKRIDAWADILHQHLSTSDSDEVLVVAHSSGCIAAVAALSRTIKRLEERQDISTTETLNLLTLGQCIPVLSHQPEAIRFRSELAHLAQSRMLKWVDVSAPPDACCFALSDPCASPFGVEDSASIAKRLSPRYAEQMSPQSYRKLKRDKFLCHFQYLRAFDTPRYYDFYRWICGPSTLEETTRGMQNISNFRRISW